MHGHRLGELRTRPSALGPGHRRAPSATLRGHTEAVVNAPWPSAPTARPSPRRGSDGTVRLWDAADRRGPGHARGHTRPVSEPWPSAPTARPSPRAATTDGAAVGRGDRRGQVPRWHGDPSIVGSAPMAVQPGERTRPSLRAVATGSVATWVHGTLLQWCSADGGRGSGSERQLATLTGRGTASRVRCTVRGLQPRRRCWLGGVTASGCRGQAKATCVQGTRLVAYAGSGLPRVQTDRAGRDARTATGSTGTRTTAWR